MKTIKISILLFSVLLFSCNTTNKSVTTNTETEKETQMDAKKMIDAGFLKGVIVTSEKEGDCPITIEVLSSDYSYFLDPINITEEYMKEGEKIWFKFNGLRMMNRCEKANPISLIEIQKRVE